MYAEVRGGAESLGKYPNLPEIQILGMFLRRLVERLCVVGTTRN